MKRLILTVIFGYAVAAAATAQASGQPAFGQLNKEAVALKIALPVPAPGAVAECLLASGKWAACPAMRNWVVPMNIRAYLADSSSQTAVANGRPTYAMLKLASYYSAEAVVKNEVLASCKDTGGALCAFAREPGTKAIGDLGKIYLVSGGKVAEIRDARLAAAADRALHEEGIKVWAGAGRASAAVGCAMQEDCWTSLGRALDAYRDWLAANKAADAKKKAKEKNKGKDEDEDAG